MADRISVAHGGSTYRCTRGGCNEPIDGPEAQDDHNWTRHGRTQVSAPQAAAPTCTEPGCHGMHGDDYHG